MLATIRDGTWYVLNMQHLTPIRKDGIIQTSSVVAINIKGPVHMVEGGHLIRKAPNLHPLYFVKTIRWVIYDKKWGYS